VPQVGSVKLVQRGNRHIDLHAAGDPFLPVAQNAWHFLFVAHRLEPLELPGVK
jgi:hypothetical protein